MSRPSPLTDIERDQLWSRIFAVPDGRALLADLAVRGKSVIRVSEVHERIGRAKARWEAGTVNPNRVPPPRDGAAREPKP